MTAGRLAVAGLALCLAACQTQPLRVAAPSGPGDREAVLRLAGWQAHGRVAVHSGAEGYNASFRWQESGERGSIDVHGPLGAGGAHIEVSAARIRIDTGTGAPLDLLPPYSALEPELVARLGFPLPLDSLRYWLTGIPSPGLPSDAVDGGFRQSDWEVTFPAFVAVSGAPVPLPARLMLQRGSTVIRVVVSDWKVDSR